MLENWQLVEETQQVPTLDQQALLAQMHDAKELRKERDRMRKRNLSEEQRNRAKEMAYLMISTNISSNHCLFVVPFVV